MPDVVQDLVGYLRNEIQNEFDPQTSTSNFISPISRAGVRHDQTDQIPGTMAFQVGQFVNFINVVIRGQPANPSRPDVVTRLDAAYSLHAPRAQTKADGTTVASFQSISAVIQQYLRDTDHVAIVGARGIGKTQFVNRWLNHQTDIFLETELEFTWFRVDMPKVYALKLDHSIDNSIATVENYYKVHAVYVVLFYSGMLIDDPARVNQTFSLAVKEAQKRHQEDFSFRDFAVRFAELCQKMNDLHQGINLSERTVHAVFRKQNSDLFEQAILAWGIISEIFNDLGYGILSIIDGIDNIAWSKNNQEYVRACAETRDFATYLREIVNNKRAKLLVVSRPETIPELAFGSAYFGYNDGLNMGVDGIKFSVVHLKVPIVDTIVDVKCKAIGSGEAFGAQRQEAKTGVQEYNQRNPGRPVSFDETVKDFVQCVQTFVGTISEEINAILASAEEHRGKFSHDVTQRGVIESVFDNDIRALLDCTVRAFRSRGSAEQLRVRGYDDNRRMLEYVVLGGRYFLDSRPLERRRRSMQIRRGDVFPNIFWFDQTQVAATQSVWHGLAGFRLLKLLEVRPLVAQDALSFIHSCFGYSPNLLLSHLEDFIAFGLIDVDAFSRTPPTFVPSSSVFAGVTSFVTLSKKGRFMLDFALAYTDWLYFLALDTPMHRLSITNKKVRFYRFPDNPKVVHFNYFDAFVPTVTTFVKHLTYYDKKELRDLEERHLARVTEQYGGLVDNFGVLRNWFSLPGWFVPHSLAEIKTALRQRQKNRHPEESYSFEDLTQDIIGVFGVSARSGTS